MRPACRTRRRTGAVKAMRVVCWAALGVALVALSGCASPATTIGATPDESRAPVVATAALKPGKTPVTLKGVLVDKCPTAACWFHLRDATGTVKVDMKASGFTVTDVPVNATVTVTGVARSDGGEPYLSATGLRY